MFPSLEFWQSFISPASSPGKQRSKSASSHQMPPQKGMTAAATSKKKKKNSHCCEESPPRRMEQSTERVRGQHWFNFNHISSSSRKRVPQATCSSLPKPCGGGLGGGGGYSLGCHGNLRTPSSVGHKVWELFNEELAEVTSWLKEAVGFTECWQAPQHSIPSIRVQLERHLAFSLEVQTHQNQTERIVFQGQDIIEQSPDASSSLGPRLQDVVSQWNLLERSLDIQAKQIKEALAVVETSINTGLKKNCNDLLIEETRDAIEFMRMKLRRNQGRSSPVNATISTTMSTNKSNSQTASKQTPVQSNSNSPLSSSPEFEVLYNELSDWLNDMHLAVSDSADMRVSEHHKQHMCKGYEQELQLREVSRSKLQRKGLQLMASRPGLTDEVRARLDSLNQQWQALQKHIAPSPLLVRKTPNVTGTPHAFGSSEQAMSMALELEEVISQLRAWLTQIEARLFESDGCCGVGVEGETELTQLESRFHSIQALRDEIERNNQSIEVVLKLCSLLQEEDDYHGYTSPSHHDYGYAPSPSNLDHMYAQSPSHLNHGYQSSSHSRRGSLRLGALNQREKETLQLGAINVERRWQNIRTQSDERLDAARERLEAAKGCSSGSSSGDEQRSSTPELPFIMEESEGESEIDNTTRPQTPTLPQDSVHGFPHRSSIVFARFQPSGAKDDDMVDGYGNRMLGQGRTIEYDDILVAREAFSENDAFSISDASEVSVEDFAFDDHLPLKDEKEDEVVDIDIALDIALEEELMLPLSETPDIMELTDEMLDAYLQMEKELQEVEAEEEEKASKARADVEFWTMSPREDHMLKREELDRMKSELVRQEDEDVRKEEDSLSESEDSAAFEKMCSDYSEAVAEMEDHRRRLDSVSSDFLSEEAEEVLECLASDEEEGDYDADLDEDCFYGNDTAHDITLQGGDNELFVDETQEFNDDFAGWMIGSMEDVAEYPESLKVGYLNSHGSTEGRTSRDEIQNYQSEQNEGYDNETGDDLPDICADDSIFSCEEVSVSPSPHNITTWPQGKFFPPIHRESFQSDSLFSSLKSLSSSPDFGCFFKATGLFPSLSSTDDGCDDNEVPSEHESPSPPFRRRSSVHQKNSRCDDSTEEKDNLLEITDRSLISMYESLDFVTELVHQIAPEERTRNFDQNSRYENFSDVVDHAQLKMSPSLSESFDIVTDIVRRMVPESDDESGSEEERITASQQTNIMEEVNDYSQSEQLIQAETQEVESCSASALSDSLPLSLSTLQDSTHTCTGSFSFTWPTNTATCDNSECRELAGIQAAVKQALSKALNGDALEENSAMEQQRVKKSKKGKKNKRKAAGSLEASPAIHDGTEGSYAGSCDTGFHSLQGTDDEKSASQDTTMKLSEVESPCTLVEDSDATPSKSGYLSYVSQIAEACSEGNLDEYLSTRKHKQCYLWSVPPAAADTPEETVIKEEIGDIEKDVSDLLLTTEELECKWELNSQATDNTDMLMEATNGLVEELKRGALVEVDDLETDKVGSWKDVIVLWMDKNGKVTDSETQGCTPFTVTPEYMQEHGMNKPLIVEEITSMTQSDLKREVSPHQSAHLPLSQRSMVHGEDQRDSVDAIHSIDAYKPTEKANVDGSEPESAVRGSRSYLSRVLRAGLPIASLLFLCVVLVVLLPTVVVSFHGDCYLSFTENLMLDTYGPGINYIRGPPPV